MPTVQTHRELVLEHADHARLANLNGPLDEHLRQLELRLGVEIGNRGNQYRVSGIEPAVDVAAKLLRALYASTATETLSPPQINLALQESGVEALAQGDGLAATGVFSWAGAPRHPLRRCGTRRRRCGRRSRTSSRSR